MGLFRVTLEATGGHGCQRDVEAGTPFFGCGRQTCPDCITQEYVDKMTKHFPVSKAELIHWPDQHGTITDTYVPAKSNVESYEANEFIDGKVVKTGEIKHFVSTFPIHRLRDKKFSS